MALTKNRGPYAANRAMQYFRGVYNDALKFSSLTTANPTRSIKWNKEHRRQEPIAWEKLPAWKATVEQLGSVRRDYLHVVLLTGLRSSDAATIRWEHVDLDSGTLHRPCPKGGEERAFTIPIARKVVEILRRRQEENRLLVGGDGGWIFPTRSNDGKVIPLVEKRWSNAKGDSPTGSAIRSSRPRTGRRTAPGHQELG